MKEEKAIVIDNFQAGVAKSIYVGHSAMAGLNNKDVGILKMSESIIESNNPYETGEYLIMKEGSYSITSSSGVDNFFYKYVGTAEQKVAAYTNTNYSPGELKEYHDKVYITNGKGTVDVYDISAGTIQTSLYSLPQGSGRSDLPMVIASDDILYFGAGGIVSSYDNSTFTGTACSLPSGRVIVSMLEYQENILILTENTSRTDIKIYSWNRQSNFADLWAEIQEPNLINFGVSNGIVYVLCGLEASLYATVGTQVNKLISFGDYIRSDEAIGKFNNNVFTVRGLTKGNANKNSFLVKQDKILYAPLLTNPSHHPFGIYSFNISTGEISQEYCNPAARSFFSSGLADRNITSIYMNGNTLSFFLYVNNTTSGDVYKLCTIGTGNTVKSTASSQSYFDSAFYQTGDTNHKKTFNMINIQLAKPMILDEELRLLYRIDENGSWVDAGTMSGTGVKSKEFPFAVTCEYLQLRVFFNSSTTASAGAYMTPELARIIIR